jgi:diaminohydroxyphosphoribosylaminopyrimidine deaminase/5-amino-6-(5-phosphoribosylamino)uracil reductase
MVGAVLVHEGCIIGEGWHRQYGQAHAEVNCLESVRDADRHLIPESTMYVSLEPCAHHGKTPPCALRLVAEKVRKVIIANIDPFEKVGGKGMQILNEAGIETVSGILDTEGAWMNRRFFCFHRQQRPYIILKWAQSQNGFMAPAGKTRLQLSNKHSRELVHKWRTEESAIMVGHATAVADDPQLTARLWQGPQPLRIALDKDLKLPHSLALFNDEADTWIINRHQEATEGRVRYVQLPFYENLLPQLLTRLYEANRLSLIVEGGAALLQSFIAAGLWDEARVFTTPVVLPDGLPAPQLTNAAAAFTTTLDTDRLHVYTHIHTQYPYAPGMAL